VPLRRTNVPDNQDDNEEQASEAEAAPAEAPVAEEPAAADDAPVAAAVAAAPAAKPAAAITPPKGPHDPIESAHRDPLPVAIAKTRKRPPFWAALALFALPLWGVLYLNSVTKPANNNDPAALGAALYATSCESCHGASGGGGAGPALNGGAVVKTWPNYKDHIDWVKKGTAGYLAEGKTTFGAENKPLSGGTMPGFGTTLTEGQIDLIVYYERTTFGNETPSADLLAAATAAATSGGK
jgi:mono/diheme cytochrome c family protein